MNFRKLASDEWGRHQSHGKWRYYRWLSAAMCAVSALMVVGMAGILLSLVGTPHLDRAALKFGAFYIVGSSAVGLAAFGVYRWLGRREPPTQQS